MADEGLLRRYERCFDGSSRSDLRADGNAGIVEGEHPLAAMYQDRC